MKNVNRKKLNNKCFTLIELLAVVVILAVVMGIAMTSVLSSMNNSRKSSLENSAKSLQQGITTKYSEAQVMGKLSSVYKDEIQGMTTCYDFNKTASNSAPVYYSIPSVLNTEFNLSPSTYIIDGTLASMKYAPTTNGTTTAPANQSFIAFNGTSFVVCLFAQKTGNMYVANYATAAAKTIKVFGKTVSVASGTMYACSNEEHSWT